MTYLNHQGHLHAVFIFPCLKPGLPKSLRLHVWLTIPSAPSLKMRYSLYNQLRMKKKPHSYILLHSRHIPGKKAGFSWIQSTGETVRHKRLFVRSCWIFSRGVIENQRRWRIDVMFAWTQLWMQHLPDTFMPFDCALEIVDQCGSFSFENSCALVIFS